jgi:hypothetical protein
MFGLLLAFFCFCFFGLHHAFKIPLAPSPSSTYPYPYIRSKMTLFPSTDTRILILPPHPPDTHSRHILVHIIFPRPSIPLLPSRCYNQPPPSSASKYYFQFIAQCFRSLLSPLSTNIVLISYYSLHFPSLIPSPSLLFVAIYICFFDDQTRAK